MSETFEITCPCCDATLLVHAETQSVLQAREPARKPLIEDLQAAVQGLKGEAARRDEAFEKSFASHRTGEQARERKFEELLKLAKQDDSGKPPRRPFALE